MDWGVNRCKITMSHQIWTETRWPSSNHQICHAHDPYPYGQFQESQELVHEIQGTIEQLQEDNYTMEATNSRACVEVKESHSSATCCECILVEHICGIGEIPIDKSFSHLATGAVLHGAPGEATA